MKITLTDAQKRVLETTGSRTRLNIMGALNLHQIEETVIREYLTINAENIVLFPDYPGNLSSFTKGSHYFGWGGLSPCRQKRRNWLLG